MCRWQGRSRQTIQYARTIGLTVTKGSKLASIKLCEYNEMLHSFSRDPLKLPHDFHQVFDSGDGFMQW
jgi:hypothetical protein